MTLINRLRFAAGLPFFLLGLGFLHIAAWIASEDGAVQMGDWFLSEDPKEVRSP
jgi:hypothetical protein